MEIVSVLDDVESLYKRTFESMGRGLLLIRVDNIQKSQAPYHYLFENGWKPPFDVAINPLTKKICYFKYFLQDEKVETNSIIGDFEQVVGEPVFSIEPFDKNVYQVFMQAEFDSLLRDERLIIVRRGYNATKAIEISEDIKVLVSNENDFAGFIFESILEREVFELRESEVIS